MTQKQAGPGTGGRNLRHGKKEGFGFQVLGFRFQVLGFRFQVSGFRFQVVLRAWNIQVWVG
jgi:hypothetical protein